MRDFLKLELSNINSLEERYNLEIKIEKKSIRSSDLLFQYLDQELSACVDNVISFTDPLVLFENNIV